MKTLLESIWTPEDESDDENGTPTTTPSFIPSNCMEVSMCCGGGEVGTVAGANWGSCVHL